MSSSILSSSPCMLWRPARWRFSLGATGAVALVIQAPVVLLLPGYAIMSAALPASTLDRLERLTLSLGLSIAVTILGGLALNLAPAGLDRYSWSVLLTLVIVGSSSVAMLRRARRRAAIPPQLSQNPEIPGVPAATVGAGVMGIGHGLRAALDVGAVAGIWTRPGPADHDGSSHLLT